jgi:hypothetical protein
MWVALAAGVATGLFQLKYEVQALERKLNRVNQAILADQQAIHVLKAEWALLNQPNELIKRAAENLELKPIAAMQIGLVTDVPARRDTTALAELPAAPPSQAATLKGPPLSIAKPMSATPVAANPMLASARTRQ